MRNAIFFFLFNDNYAKYTNEERGYFSLLVMIMVMPNMKMRKAIF